MKNFAKILLASALCLTVVFSAVGCSSDKAEENEECFHKWESATCEAPRTCSKCGETIGEKLEHEWVDATCDAPKTCSLCAATEGDTVHEWIEATCETAKTCALCDLIEGEIPGHKTAEGVCEVCGLDVAMEKLYEKLYSCELIDGYHQWTHGTQDGGTMGIKLNPETEDISFVLNLTNNNIMYLTSINYVRGSSSLDVSQILLFLDYGSNGIFITDGVIYPDTYSRTSPQIHSCKTKLNDTVVNDYQFYMSFESQLGNLVEYVSMLIEDIDLDLEDLGFTAFKIISFENE